MKLVFLSLMFTSCLVIAPFPGDDGSNGLNGKNGVSGVDGKNGVDGKDGTDGENSAIFLEAVKEHKSTGSNFIPQTKSTIGYILIPEKAYIVEGCGSNDGGTNKAAQLTIDDSITCRYNPKSTVNRPCGTSQEEKSKTYHLVNCDLGYQEGDILQVDESVRLNLTKADSNIERVVLRMKLELN